MNRAQRRQVVPKGTPGAVPVTVTREVPVTILTDSDGGRTVVEHDTAEPCYGCACCAVWARSLDQLAAAMRTHHDEEHLVPLVHNHACMVCAMLAGALDG